MGHGINKNEDMVYANYEVPWHGLGVPVDGLFTSQEALQKANIDFEVVKKPIYRQILNLGDGQKDMSSEFIEIPDKFETVRTDTDENLGVVGNYYQPYNNRDAFAFLDSLIKEGDACYDTAGALFGGKKVWMLMKLPDYISVNGDQVDKFLLCTNSHDGSTPIMLKLTPIRVVCNNTLSVALGNYKTDKMTIKVRHTMSAGIKMEEAARILGLSSAYFEKAGQIYGEMAGFKLTTKTLNKYYKLVIPDPVKTQFKFSENGELEDELEEIKGNSTRAEKAREQLVEIFETSPTIKGTPAEGNLWGAYNSVTEYIQHHKMIPYENEKEGQRFNITMIDNNSGAQYMRQQAFTGAVKMLN